VGRMNKTIVIITGIIVTGLLIGYYIYSNNSIVKSINGNGSFLTEGEQKKFYSLSNKQNLAEDESRLFEHLRKSLIRIVEKSIGEETIYKRLAHQKGDFKIIGWRTKGIDEQTILLNYTFKKDGKLLGWYYEVKSGGRIIRTIAFDNKELKEKYNLVEHEEKAIELGSSSKISARIYSGLLEER